MKDLRRDYGTFAGVIAHGRDYRRAHDPQGRQNGRQLTPEKEEILIRSLGLTQEVYEETKARVAGGELEELGRRTRRKGLVAALAADEAADWLGTSSAELDRLLAAGVVTAFVCDGELRYPAWQFTDDPSSAVLPGLARLTPEWGDQLHPATIQSFMYNAELPIRGTDESFTPVEWLAIGGDMQAVLDALETFHRW